MNYGDRGAGLSRLQLTSGCASMRVRHCRAARPTGLNALLANGERLGGSASELHAHVRFYRDDISRLQ